MSITQERYSMPAIVLHWLLALMIVIAFGVGLSMSDMPLSPQRLKLYNYHKWAGITILALSALRLLWRLTHKPPPEPPMPTWQRLAAQFTHFALYALFFLVPLAGWAYSSAAGFPIVWFGVLPLPDFVPVDKALAELMKERHGMLAWALAILVVGHIGAAFQHHFILRDGLLNRMKPSSK